MGRGNDSSANETAGIRVVRAGVRSRVCEEEEETELAAKYSGYYKF